MKFRLFAITVVAVLAGAAGAQAEQRYASPTGKGTGCTQVDPCSLETAVGKAKNKDEVIIGSGSYTAKNLQPEDFEIESLFIHGDFGGPMPIVSSSADESFVFLVSGQSSVLSWVDVRASGQEGTGVVCGYARVERVRASSSGRYGSAIYGSGTCAIADTVAVATGDEASALRLSSPVGSVTGSVTNSTAVATGPGGYGISASFAGVFEIGKYTADIANTIAQGTAGDLVALGFSKNEFAEIVVSHSNFDNPVQKEAGIIVNAGGNQSAPPVFVDAGAGNYAEAAGSPTINAGVVGPGIGALDLAGNPRTLGGTVDIGAFEFVPPVVPPPAPGQIQSLLLSPATFVGANLGEAAISKKKPPVGTNVAYALTAAATVEFSVERKVLGRKAGKRCVKKTKTNKGKKKCPLFRPVKGSFAQPGSGGANIFKFSGRIGGKTLAPGSYRLTGTAGGAGRRADFKIVK